MIHYSVLPVYDLAKLVFLGLGDHATGMRKYLQLPRSLEYLFLESLRVGRRHLA